MRRARRFASWAFIGLFLLSLLARLYHPPAKDVAIRSLELQGHDPSDLRVHGYTYHFGPGGSSHGWSLERATWRFTPVAEPDDELAVSLRRPVWFLGWRVEQNAR